jgi:hypothetical protein
MRLLPWGKVARRHGSCVHRQTVLAEYGGKKLSTLWSTVHTEMPMNAPVPAKDSIDIMAFLLQKNGIASGFKPLDDSVDLSKVLLSK